MRAWVSGGAALAGLVVAGGLIAWKTWPEHGLQRLTRGAGHARPHVSPPPLDSSDPLQVPPGFFLERYVFQVMTPLREADVDLNGLDANDIERVEARRRMQIRALRLQEVFSVDLDGDMKVTRDEAMAAVEGPYGERRVNRLFERFDRNGDGVIEAREVHALVDREERERERAQGRRPAYGGDPRSARLLALDPNGDGRLTAKELRTLAEAAFRRVDTDGDEHISEAEYGGERERLAAAHPKPALDASLQRPAPGPCRLPAAAADTQVVVYGTYDGANDYRGWFGAHDPRTSTATVEIQPGARPLYVILSSYDPMVWTFEGATTRVAQVVQMTPRAAREGAATGVKGVAPEKVASARADACFGYFSKPEAINAVSARATVRKLLGREPEVVAAAYKTDRVVLPAGRAVQPRGYDEPRRFSAWGLPDELEPLVASGALLPLGDRDVKIVKPIGRWPAKDDSRVLRVLLGPGVPEPAGLPDRICVVTDQGELVNPGFSCKL